MNTTTNSNDIKIQKKFSIDYYKLLMYRNSILKLKFICYDNKIECIREQNYEFAFVWREVEDEIIKCLKEFDINQQIDETLIINFNKKIDAVKKEIEELIIKREIEKNLSKYNL